MDVKFKNNRLLSQLEDPENSPENSGYSPVSNDTKIASTSSSKRSRQALQKRVVSVRIKDIEGFRKKGDQMSAPPFDSWAWRKYGQKPIKGSPYPRGYYRCSSSKGCPARKQVERSRMDPNMLLITYSCEHNHPSPASRNHNHHQVITAPDTTTNVTTSVSEEDEEEEEEEEEVEEKKPDLVTNQSHHETVPEYKFTSLGEGPLIQASGEFGWFSDFESPSCTMLESPILAEDRIATDNEMAMIFTMQEEDESLFADLGELPECSMEFNRAMAQQEAERRQHSLATTS